MSSQTTVPSRRPARLLALPLLVLAACEPDPAEPTSAQLVPVATQSAQRGGENPVLRWHLIAADLMVDPGPVIDSRAFAILQAAVHDAVNGVERRYRPFTADLSSPEASLEAAVATAAHDVLIALSPSQRRKIEAKYDAALEAVPDPAARARGVRLGRKAAKANLDRRKGDDVPVGPWPPLEGRITRPVYVPTGKPGDYQFTPPFDAPPLGPIALFPGWGRLEPFVAAADKRVLEGPYPLHSRAYADDFNEIKAIGRLNSSTRTADQTEIAHFWFEEFPIWIRIANGTIRKEGLDSWDAARILAQMHLAMADAGIACFEAKYRFRYWRPYTAIRRAAEDGNPDTDPGANWLPLLWTRPGLPPTFLIPPIPDYPSAAATLASAAAEILIAHLGDRIGFEATSPFLPGVTRRFGSFSEAATEAGRSRVYGGIHYTKAVRDGWRLGKSVGSEVSRSLPPVAGTAP